MMSTLLLLLLMGMAVHVHTVLGNNESTSVAAAWTYNVKCHHCSQRNSFHCGDLKTCEYETRRCLTLSVRVSARDVIVYKDCTFNCSFVYAAHQVPPTPKSVPRTNSYYYAQCCSGMSCNEGGPKSIVRDILPDEAIEEDLPEGAVRLGQLELLMSLASVLVSSALI